MALIKSDSILFGIGYETYANLFNFYYLPYISNFNLNINQSKLDNKYIGSQQNLRKKYLIGNVNLSISYISSNDFFAENMMGLLIGNTSLSAFYSLIANDTVSPQNNINNNSLFGLALISDKTHQDLIYSLDKFGYDASLKYINLTNLLMTKYSISYAIGNFPSVTVDFSADNLYSSTIFNDSGWKFVNAFKTTITLPSYSTSSTLLKNKNYYSTYTLSSTASNSGIGSMAFLLNGEIQSLNLDIDLKRNDFYFLFKKQIIPTAYERQLIVPINASLKISGVSTALFNGAVYDDFINDTVFDFTISIIENKVVTNKRILMKKVKINSFNYQVTQSGLLAYQIDCSFDITTTDGLFFFNT